MRTARIRILLAASLMLMLAGCATSPISKNLREEAKPLTVAQVTANPDAYKGDIVIWGGRIIETVNDTNGANIYLLKLPLNGSGRPESGNASDGRFIAHRNSFVDPEILKKGQLVTVAGALAGVETQPLQQTQYTYPVVSIDEMHLWLRRPAPYPYPAWGWGWYGSPGWGYYGPGWGPAWYGPRWNYYGPGWGWRSGAYFDWDPD